jgi:hypothetical protein
MAKKKHKTVLRAAPPVKAQPKSTFINRIYAWVAAIIILSLVLSVILASIGGNGGGSTTQPGGP